MAKRPVYLPSLNSNLFVETKYVDFNWVKGMAFSQKQKCVDSFHSEIIRTLDIKTALEVSSKSKIEIGVSLSAFNLMIENNEKQLSFSVECAFQSAKVFEHGGPFPEIQKISSREAKKFFADKKELGSIIAFQSNGCRWPTYPTTLFYDWLYINALARKPNLIADFIDYEAFTDIEFNPKKSRNCQAYSVALFCSLYKRGILNDVISCKEKYRTIIMSMNINNSHENQSEQPNLKL